MSGDSSDSNYSEHESALILQRAAELQAQQGQRMSLRDLESVATEAGIDAALVRRAAFELRHPPPTSGPSLAPATPRILGLPLRLVHERAIAGSFDNDRVADLVGEIEQHLGTRGRLSPSGRQFRWSSSKTSSRDLRIAITPSGDHMLLRIDERLTGLAGGLFLGLALPLALSGLGFIIPISLAVLGMPILIPFVFIVWVMMSFGLARTIDRSVAQDRDAQLGMMVEALADIAEQRALMDAQGADEADS